MKDNYTVSFIIPNWNGKHLLEKHLPSICSASQNNEIIVVDDVSTDDSIFFLERKYPHIKVISTTKNQGFASAVNLGVQHASGEIIVLLNTDVEPEKNFLTPLLSHFSDKTVFGVGCLEESIEDKEIILRGRGEAFWRNGMYIHRRGEVNNIDTAWVSGGSGAFRKSFWNKLGGLDELMNPFYWEDIDISYRALKLGYTLSFETRSKIRHYHEEGSIKTSQQEKMLLRINFRNQLIFTWKNITSSVYIREHRMFLLRFIVKQFLIGNYPFVLGFIDAMGKLPEVMKKRKKNYPITDEQILPRFTV